MEIYWGSFYSEAMYPATIEKPDRERLKRHLARVCVTRDVFADPGNLQGVQEYLENELRSAGHQVEHHPFIYEGRRLTNLRAFRHTAPHSAERFLIGAHFDAVPGTPGADDNASGVAALLEAARLSASKAAEVPVEFLLFNAEEYGMAGSTRYVESLKKEKIRVGGMISLEMVGYADPAPGSQKIPAFLKPFYPDTGDFLALVGDLNSRGLLKKARAAFSSAAGAGHAPPLPVHGLTLPFKGWVLPETRLSDHSPFWDAGYPALLVTDTSFFRNPNYHLPSDTIETLNMDFLMQVTEGVVRLVHTLK